MPKHTADTLLAYPGIMPPVKSNVEALAVRGRLQAFATTIVGTDRRRSTLDRLRCRRAAVEAPTARIHRRERWEWARIAASRLSFTRLCDRIWWHEMRDFAAWAGGIASKETAVVHGYETAALELFEQTASAIRLLELPAAEYSLVSRRMAAEAASFPDLANHVGVLADPTRESARRERRRREIELADYLLVFSEYQKSSYIEAGVDANKILLLPHGMPSIHRRPAMSSDGTLRMIWAGNFSVGKGAHYLTLALEKLQSQQHAWSLDVFGNFALPATWRRRLPTQVRLHGPVSQPQLFTAMHRADLLVLPSLSDAFGMVITEAFAHGLPSLATDATGAADFIVPGHNGETVPARDVQRLVDVLEDAVRNPSRWRRMQPACYATARRWTWADHQRAYLRTIDAIS